MMIAESIMQSMEALNQIFLVFGVAFYLTQCYLGYKCLKAFVAVVGFVIGFLIGFGLMCTAYTQDAYIPAAVGIAAGVGLAFLAFKLYIVGVFIFCGSLAARAVSMLPLSDEGTQSILMMMLCLAAFVVVGILAVKFSRLCIIVITAITGSVNAVNLLRTPIEAIDGNTVLRIIVIIFIAATGILVQNITAKQGRKGA